ncbi:host attachment protein [Novosphingobium sp.]|uniref:baeRF12 domain-containing protein n=1 Tax=Novosphingobium sp. TaxID=1874826 RepID=UPI00334182C9
MLIPHGTLVVLADSHDWRLLRNAGTEAVPVLTKVPLPALNEPHHASGHAGQRLAEASHAAAIGEWLHHQVTALQVDHLVLIAPPRVLGELRRHLPAAVERVVRKELSKDLIGRHETEIVAVLQGA